MGSNELLTRWDSAEYLRNETDIEGYLEAALQEGGDDPAYMLHVLNTIARARHWLDPKAPDPNP